MVRDKVLGLTEDQIQIRVVVYLHKRGVPVFAIPNGSSRNLIEAVKLKRTGVSSGVPDLCVPVPRSSYHGLFLELKRDSRSVVSVNQRNWHHILRREGYFVSVARGFDEAKKVIDDYLGGWRPAEVSDGESIQCIIGF